ncbi:MAG: redoxin domain-containing protein [Gemmatimonadota bacterium]|nr:MAG: redoxin domain-containing protein [Gemmatimonadota bacterium]
MRQSKSANVQQERIMRKLLVRAFVLGLAIALAAVGGVASAQAQGPEPLELGAVAPDFSLPAATRDGVLESPIKLSDYKGKTVVLAFFFKARTGG